MFCISFDGLDRVGVPCTDPTALIVMNRVELAQYSPFYLDIESAGAIGGAFLMVMAVAFVFRLIRKSLESSESSEL